MFTPHRSSRFTFVIGFTLIALVSGLVLTATAGASPRFGFIGSIGEYFGMISSGPAARPFAAIPPGETSKGGGSDDLWQDVVDG